MESAPYFLQTKLPSIEVLDWLKFQIIQKVNGISDNVVREDSPKDTEKSFDQYCIWYTQHLHQHVAFFLEQKPSSLSMIFTEEEINSKDTMYEKLFEMMDIAIEGFRVGETSIEAIATSLSNKGVISGDILDGTSRSKSCYQLVFIVISWMTMLFKAKENPLNNGLQLSLVDSSDPRKVLRSATWRKLVSPIEGLSTLPLKHLLARFGKFTLLPASTESALVGKYNFGVLLASNFSYETLGKVAKIRIEWVDSMTLHLEFDERTATLKLFRFPSFCAMMCLNPREGSSTFLSQ